MKKIKQIKIDNWTDNHVPLEKIPAFAGMTGVRV